MKRKHPYPHPIRTIKQLLTLSALACATTFPLQADPPPASGNWTLTFEDHFNGTSLNTSVWNTGHRHSGTINGEPQAYRPEAVSVANGVCTITASKFSGQINNAGGYAQGTTTINVDGFPGAIPNGSVIHVDNADLNKSDTIHLGPSYLVVSTVGGSNPTQITIEAQPYGYPTPTTNGPGLQAAVADNAPVYLTYKIQNMTGYEWGSFPYRSGLIQTYDKWTQTYGYYEARVKMSSARGTWPAFWLMPDRGAPNNVYARTAVGTTWTSPGDTGTVPMGNEIDIFEYMGSWKDPNTNLASSHSGYFWSYSSGGSRGAFTLYNDLANPDTEFHTYGLYWGPDELRYYIDGEVVYTNADVGNVGECPHYLMLNMAMTVGDWTPFGNLDRLTEIDPDLPGYMEIDYVRVWSGDAGAGNYSGDIGTIGVAGSHSFNGSTTTVQASGADIWNAADSFHLVGQEFAGDGSITVKVESLSNTHEWAKAGLMFRENADAAGSRHVFIGKTPSGSVSMQARSTTDGSSSNIATVSGSLPGWIRLTRSGNTFTGEMSSNGTSWTTVGSTSLSGTPERLVAGLATSSHDNGTLTTAVFDSFSPSVSLESIDIVNNPWLTPGVAGSASYSNGVYTVQGSGNGWGTDESRGHMAFQQISGDAVVIAHVTSITGGDQYWARAGVMFREHLVPNSRFVSLSMTPFSHCPLQYRTSTGAAAQQDNTSNWDYEWVKLVREGSTFTGYFSEDGDTWVEGPSVTLDDLNETLYVGLAVSSNTTSALTTATFEDVSINNWDGTQTTPPGGGTTNVALNGSIDSVSGAETGNPPENLIDGIDDTDTNRWSAPGMPQWVIIDLGSDMQISGTEVATYANRSYRFTVEARSAAGSYQTVVDRTANTITQNIADTFTPVTARYVRLTVDGAGNYGGSWVSLREFKIFGESGGGSSGSLTISSVSATAEQTGNEAVNSFDGNFSTRWASSGTQSITWDLGATHSVEEIQIAFYNTRTYYFDIEASTDGSSWTTVLDDEVSAGVDENLEAFPFSAPVNARYIRYVGFGSNANSWNNIYEVDIIGQ